MYAHNFVEKGILQLKSLSFYTEMEDKMRKDKDERVGRVIINMNRPVLTVDKYSGQTLSEHDEYGPVYFSTSSINPRYILCFSGPQVVLPHLTSHYGNYVVRINQPNSLVREIGKSLENNPTILGVMYLECVQVRYDRDQLVNDLPEPASQNRARLAYAQKHPDSSLDCEYRLVITFSLTTSYSAPFITLFLDKRLPYAEII